MNEQSAIEWWCSVVGDKNCIEHEQPLPRIAQKVWQKECPSLLLYDIEEKPINEYWNKIKKIITKTTDDYSPDPNFDFFDFLNFLHKKLVFFSPKNLGDCITIGQKYTQYTKPQEIAYRYPLICRNPDFFIDSLYHIWEVSSYSVMF